MRFPWLTTTANKVRTAQLRTSDLLSVLLIPCIQSTPYHLGLTHTDTLLSVLLTSCMQRTQCHLGLRQAADSPSIQAVLQC